jgi:hypothetical protein
MSRPSDFFADYYVFNRDTTIPRIGFSCDQHSGLLAYGHTNFSSATASFDNLEANVGTLEVLAFNSTSQDVMSATRNEMAAFAVNATVLVYRFDRPTLSWALDVELTAAHFAVAAAPEDGGDATLAYISAVALDGRASPPVVVVGFVLSTGFTAVAVFEQRGQPAAPCPAPPR